MLHTVLVRRLVLPALGVLVANVLRVVAFLAANLTDLSHDDSFPSRTRDTVVNDTRFRAPRATARGQAGSLRYFYSSRRLVPHWGCIGDGTQGRIRQTRAG